MNNTITRQRTFHWQEPLPVAGNLSGLAFFEAMNEGKLPLPPLMHTLDFTPVKIEKGRAVFSFQPQEFHYNPIGTVHGGVITAILDSAMGCTVHSMLEAGMGYTTLEIKVNFLKPVTLKTGLLKATGKLIHLGGRTALVEAQLTDNSETVYAHGVSTCLLLSMNKLNTTKNNYNENNR